MGIEEQLETVGRDVALLPSGSELEQGLKAGSLGIDKVVNEGDKLIACRDVVRDLAVQDNAGSPPYGLLAMEILDHDLVNTGAIAGQSLIQYKVRSKGQVPDAEDWIRRELFFRAYDNLRIGIAVMGIVATGNQALSFEVDTARIPMLMDKKTGPKHALNYDFDGAASVTAAEYFAIHQLVKNAKKNFENNGIEGDIQVRIIDVGLARVIGVTDTGTGIPSADLPKIFNGYSRDGTGVGLRVVNRLIDLNGGYIWVKSAVKGKPTYVYSTQLPKSAFRADATQNHGTTFELHLPL